MDTKYHKFKTTQMGTLLRIFSAIVMCFLLGGIKTVFGETLLPADAFWNVYDVSGNQYLGSLQAPFGYWPTGINPPFNTFWDDSGLDPVWAVTNTVDLTGVTLASVRYSTAIDNDFQLFVNGQSVETVQHDGAAQWSAPQAFPSGSIHSGNNTITVLITNRDVGTPSFFTMRITDGCDDVPEVGSPSISSSTFSFGASGQSNTTWSVCRSTDLTLWTIMTNTTLNGVGQGSVVDTSISGVPYQFYKLSNSACCSRVIGFIRKQVGGVTINTPSTNALFANQLDTAGGNTLDHLFNVNGGGTMPDGTAFADGTIISKWINGAWTNYTWTSVTGWLDQGGNFAGNVTLNPGEGGFLITSNAITMTFVGLVREGAAIVNPIGAGMFLYSSVLPKVGGVTTDLAYPPDNVDKLYRWDGLVYPTYTYRSTHWAPSEPSINVGEAFFINTGTSKNWTQSFFPCQ